MKKRRDIKHSRSMNRIVTDSPKMKARCSLNEKSQQNFIGFKETWHIKNEFENCKQETMQHVRNSRYGGERKVTAYRPCTSMDTFRRRRLEVILEEASDNLDLDEGRRIWSDVNTIIENSGNKQKRMREKLNNEGKMKLINFHNSPSTVMDNNTSLVPMDTDKNRAMDLNCSIELTPYLNCRNQNLLYSTDNRVHSMDTNSEHKWMNRKTWITDNTVTGVIGHDHCDKNKTMDRYLVKKAKPRLKDENFLSEGNVQAFDETGVTFDSRDAKLYIDNDITIRRVKFKMDDVVFGDNQSKHWRPYHQYSAHSNEGPLVHLPIEGACSSKTITMTTTTLPRITPMSTPLPTGITQPPPRSHSSASTYVPYPPRELSNSFDFLRIPGRVNPLAPPPPRKRINWSWETTDQHYENEKRRLLMQKREHTRYHSAWGKAFYGAPAEKEAYRRHFREVLKQQMADKSSMDKMEFKEKIRETEQAISYDRDCRFNDAQEYHRKHAYLMQYRDVNKQQMEDRWATNRYNRELENRIDRERLRYNPINWSCSLK